MDSIDSKIAALLNDGSESKSSASSSGSSSSPHSMIKSVGIALAASLLVSGIITYVVRPQYVLAFEVDTEKLEEMSSGRSKKSNKKGGKKKRGGNKRRPADDFDLDDIELSDDEMEMEDESDDASKVEIKPSIKWSKFAIFTLALGIVLTYPVHTTLKNRFNL